MLETQQLTIEAFAYRSAISAFLNSDLDDLHAVARGADCAAMFFRDGREMRRVRRTETQDHLRHSASPRMGTWHRSKIFPQGKRQV